MATRGDDINEGKKKSNKGKYIYNITFITHVIEIKTTLNFWENKMILTNAT